MRLIYLIPRKDLSGLSPARWKTGLTFRASSPVSGLQPLSFLSLVFYAVTVKCPVAVLLVLLGGKEIFLFLWLVIMIKSKTANVFCPFCFLNGCFCDIL